MSHTLETVSDHSDFWYYCLKGDVEVPDAGQLVEGVDAVSDCWFALLAPELLRQFPRAKIILTTRDPASSWLRSYRSYQATSGLYDYHRQMHRLLLARVSTLFGIGSILRKLDIIPASTGLDLENLPVLMDIWRRIDDVVYGSTRPNFLWKTAYDRHNAFVRSLVPEDQLIDFDVSRHGYQELIDFLGLDNRTTDAFPTLNCVPTKTCVSHLSEQHTFTHEKIIVSLLLVISFAIALTQRGGGGNIWLAPSKKKATVHVKTI